MAVVHSYKRFSSAKQELGTSLERQTEDVEKFCQKHSHRLSDVTYHDLGISGFKGQQKALDALLRAIERGLIQSGDILFVEALDRLSRRGIRATQNIINQILDAGVCIAISSPYEKIYRPSQDNIGDTIEIASFAFQAYNYSKQLSGRIQRSWAKRRENLSTEKFGSKLPAWLIKDGNKFIVKKEAKAAIKYIFTRALDGVGGTQLCEELNAKFEPITESGKWNKTYVRMIIRERKVRGEYQPNKLDENSKAQPCGEVLKNYYPEIIDEKTWLAANQALDNRCHERGPKKEFINLFTGLLFIHQDNCAAHLTSTARKDKKVLRRIKSYNAVCKIPGSTTATIGIEDFEHVVLSYLHEIDMGIFNNGNKSQLELTAAQGELNKTTKRIEKLQAALAEDEDFESLLGPLKKLEEKKAELEEKVRELATLTADSPKDNISKIKKLNRLENNHENRQKLRQAIKQVVKRINIMPVKLGPYRRSPVAAAVEIEFMSGCKRTIMMGGKKHAAAFGKDGLPEKPTKVWMKTFKNAAEKFLQLSA